ncbi:MAG: TetR/AcrR family transcriptional regulator [Solirubrobacteraceae bacterium]
MADLSLRPLATAVNSSPRVLLFLFGSKAELVQALLARAREEELELLSHVGSASKDSDLTAVASELWGWLSADEHRELLTLWVEGYARSLIDVDGPWANFARSTVEDWLEVLAQAQPEAVRDSAVGEGRRTLVLAVLRGAVTRPARNRRSPAHRGGDHPAAHAPTRFLTSDVMSPREP